MATVRRKSSKDQRKYWNEMDMFERAMMQFAPLFIMNSEPKTEKDLNALFVGAADASRRFVEKISEHDALLRKKYKIPESR